MKVSKRVKTELLLIEGAISYRLCGNVNDLAMSLILALFSSPSLVLKASITSARLKPSLTRFSIVFSENVCEPDDDDAGTVEPVEVDA